MQEHLEESHSISQFQRPNPSTDQNPLETLVQAKPFEEGELREGAISQLNFDYSMFESQFGAGAVYRKDSHDLS